MRPQVEICVDDVAGALTAEAAGADRIELCVGLSEGGLTPSIGLVRTVLDQVRRVGVQVMIRPRGGDFEVSAWELQVMLADIAAVRALPHHDAVRVGFVFGALTADGMVDEVTTCMLVLACGSQPVTFHKAFDAASDLPATLDTLASCGIGRILSSGGASSASAGSTMLARLIARSAGRIEIIAGGGVRAENVAALLSATGAREIHLRAMRPIAGRGDVTCRDEIARLLRACRGGGA